ncbi:hypothetical protein RJT34_31577 [Clitoria ternatea]|uniref:Conserved oligomeric Golgi complex subunit 7 n=1 Tax=Clitoria ternatea TaxID=43366 RepID=A0AAN9I300_CLITE
MLSSEDGAAHQKLRVGIVNLHDAAQLTQLSSTVEDVFASGDLPGAAETPANMGHSLSAVGEGAFPLPTFSVYPQSYVTSVDEYLLTLPQHLEPLAEGMSNSESNDEAQFFATEWMFKVAEGATALYIEQLGGIKKQLSVDIKYLSYELSALSMPIPRVLATFQSCLSTPKNQLKDRLKTDPGNQLDLPTANLVCKMRRVNLDS